MSARERSGGEGGRPAWAAIGAVAALKLLLHLSLAGRYGYFRDELYFLDCGRHLAWGYVDHAPLIGLVSHLALLLGGSLPVVRAIPAVAGAGVVVLTALIAWRLGGGAFAQLLAGLAVVAVPVYLGVTSILSMNVFEPLFWMGCAYVLIRIVQTGDGRRWLLFGLLAGVGLMNKHSTAFFGAAVAAGLLLTPLRRWLATPWPWLGAVTALAVFLPNLVWQALHGFPTLEALRNVARTGKNVVLAPVEFVGQQVLIMNPVLLPLWLAGLLWLFRARSGRYRALAWSFVVLFGLLLALKAKNYYLAPAYPMLLAAGAVALQAGLDRWRATAGRAWPRAAAVAVVGAAGAALAPLTVPLLPPEGMVAYQEAIGVAPPRTEVSHTAALPQLFADQFGWPELVAEVARVHAALPAEDRRRAAIYAENYGEAGAVNHFGPRHGLPTAVSGHQNYFYWGPRGATGEVLIVLGAGDDEELRARCDSVELAGRHHHPWGMPFENRPIYVCRGLKPPLSELWPQLKWWY